MAIVSKRSFQEVIEYIHEQTKKEMMDYSTYYLEAMKEIKAAHDCLINREFQQAHDHCMNAQAEIRLMSVNVKSWIPVEGEEK